MWFAAFLYLALTACISLGLAHRWTPAYGITAAAALVLLGILALVLWRRESRQSQVTYVPAADGQAPYSSRGGLVGHRSELFTPSRAAAPKGSSSMAPSGSSRRSAASDSSSNDTFPSPAHWSFYSPSFVNGGGHGSPKCSSSGGSYGGHDSGGSSDCGGGSDGGGGGGD